MECELRKWLADHGIREIPHILLEKPPSGKFGDLSTSLPLSLSRKLRVPPMKVAEDMAKSIRAGGLIGEVKTVPPGYVNFFVDFSQLSRTTLDQLHREGDDFGSVSLGKKLKVQVEHTSVNPNKALHIGHARNMAIGTAVANLLSFTGHNVEVISYIDDTGTQVADIVLGFLQLGFKREKPGVKFDQYCGDEVYVKVTKMLEESPELQKLRSEIMGMIDKGGNEVASFAKSIAIKVLREQLVTCWRLMAEYDLLVWESEVLRNNLWDATFEEMKMRGLARYETEGKFVGCWVVDLEPLEDQEGLEEVLVRSDGTTTYVAKDISTAMWKLGKLRSPFKYSILADQPSGKPLWSTQEGGEDRPFGAADASINVIDIRQARLQSVIKLLLSRLYGKEFGSAYTHYSYEVVSLSAETASKHFGIASDKEFLHMSGRKGIYVNIDIALDLMKKVAMEESAKRNPNLDKGELAEIGEKIAVTSLKYPLLASDRDKIAVFDVDKALNITEESGSYLLYGYARAMRVLEKSPSEPDHAAFEAACLSAEEETLLLKMVSEFPAKVRDAAEGLDVKSLTRYAYDLTLQFNKFYETCPILTSEPATMNARLLLVKAYTQTLRNAMKILALPLVSLM